MRNDINKDNLVVTMATMPLSLDPIDTDDKPSARINAQIFEELFKLDESLNIVPSLAESWSFVDATTLKIMLKKGIKFHNGLEVKAEDVEFSICRAAKSSVYSYMLHVISNVEASDDYTVVVKLKNPFVPILAHLANFCTSIVSKAEIEKVGEEAHRRAPIGTGPFKFGKWISKRFTTSVELLRFDEYHGKASLIENISFKSIPESSLRISEVERGRVDIAYDIFTEDIERIKATSKAVIVKSHDFSVSGLGFNCQHPPFDNILVRRAVCHGVNRDEIMKKVYDGEGTLSNGPISPKIWGSAHDKLVPFEYDVKKAKTLLKEAGYEHGFKAKIFATERLERLNVAMIIQNNLKLLNIDCEIVVIEWSEFLRLVSVGIDGMFLFNWVAITGDADYALHQLFYYSKKGGNYLAYSNMKVNELLDEGRQEFDLDKRKQIYFEAQKLICSDAPCLFYQQGDNLTAVRPNVRGLRNHHYNCHALWDVYFE